MSEKHIKGYKFIKYCLSTTIDEDDIDINWYHVKTVALIHSRECSTLSESCVTCVLKMLTDLKHAYKAKTHFMNLMLTYLVHIINLPIVIGMWESWNCTLNVFVWMISFIRVIHYFELYGLDECLRTFISYSSHCVEMPDCV